MADKIADLLQTYTRTETRELVEVTEDNIMEIARLLGWSIEFREGMPMLVSERLRVIQVGTLIDKTGIPNGAPGWRLAETSGNLINGEDLR